LRGQNSAIACACQGFPLPLLIQKKTTFFLELDEKAITGATYLQEESSSTTSRHTLSLCF